MVRHFLDFADLDANELASLLAQSLTAKNTRHRPPALAGRLLVMVFEKSSTRTRISFAAAMARAGGSAVMMDTASSQLSRGETIADTARAISPMADAVMIRANRHDTITEFAAHSACPVINGLSDRSHPCQVLADVMTFSELRGSLAGHTIAWIGDCNNMLFSWAQAAALLNAKLVVSCPPAYRSNNIQATFADSPLQAAENASLVMTDVWASMGDEEEQTQRKTAFADYIVDERVMQCAATDAVFMHCLPAHRGEEVSAGVIDGPQSVVWQQAENRLHAQKALLEFLIPPGAAEAKT